MIEIKFRGLSMVTNTWFYGYYYVNDKMKHIIVDESFNHIICNPDTITQYTGLKDKNGKEIYEGDIVKTGSDKLMVIGWSKRHASFVIDRDGWAFVHYFGEAFEAQDCEVVGNIFEHKKLLNK